MKAKRCPECETWMSCDTKGFWYCHECNYEEPPKMSTRWSWEDE